MSDWIDCKDKLPPLDISVMTKIHDEKGPRNEQMLKRFNREPGVTRDLWFFPDGSMYVYYTPTHWKY